MANSPRITQAIQALRDEYEVQTQGILDDDLSDTSISVDCGDLFIALEALDALAELRDGLALARNRLQAVAINEAPKQTREYYDYSQWADEATSLLERAQ